RLDHFLGLLPHDTEAARRLARHHDERVGDPGFGPEGRRTIRHALEIRHPSFFSAEADDIVRRNGIAPAASHSAAWDDTEEVTADFVYVRLHGPRALYDSRYRPDELAHWAERVRRWHAGRQPVDARRITSLPLPSRRKRDVFLYFDNDGHAYAPEQALEMQRLLGLDQGPTEESGAQPRTRRYGRCWATTPGRSVGSAESRSASTRRGASSRFWSATRSTCCCRSGSRRWQVRSGLPSPWP